MMSAVRTVDVPQLRHRLGRSVWVCVAVLVGALTSTARAAALDGPSRRPGDAATLVSQFRLGDAARPFAWATALADFNHDGRVDVAIADRTREPAGVYTYRLEIDVAGLAPQHVRFESTHSAIAISAADVDRDQNIDIVVRAPLSGETVGVWLNDGRGRFTRTRVPGVRHPVVVRETSAVSEAPATEPLAVVATTAGRLDVAPLPTAAAVIANDGAVQPAAAATSSVRTSHRACQLHPRAPPAIGARSTTIL
jgi:hypothetical protein